MKKVIDHKKIAFSLLFVLFFHKMEVKSYETCKYLC
nr:MAG TPA: hypothetical protein [Caudoviricetes sp.]